MPALSAHPKGDHATVYTNIVSQSLPTYVKRKKHHVSVKTKKLCDVLQTRDCDQTQDP